MKKTYLLIAFLGAFLFSGLTLSSCSDDDDDASSETSQARRELLGTWMTSDDNWGYRFMEGGDCICYESTETCPGSYRTRNGHLYIYWEGDTEPEIFTEYVVDGNRLYLMDEYGDSYVLYRS